MYVWNNEGDYRIVLFVLLYCRMLYCRKIAESNGKKRMVKIVVRRQRRRSRNQRPTYIITYLPRSYGNQLKNHSGPNIIYIYTIFFLRLNRSTVQLYTGTHTFICTQIARHRRARAQYRRVFSRHRFIISSSDYIKMVRVNTAVRVTPCARNHSYIGTRVWCIVI